LRPHLASLPLFAQLAVYSAVLILWCWIFYNGFEAPILAARPRYPKVGEKQESFANRFPNAFSTVTAGISNRGKADWLRLAAILALATAAFAGVERLQESRNSIYFYAALLAAAVAIVALFAETGLWRVALARVVALTGLLVAIFLPVADYIFLRLQTKETAQVVRPVYSYAEAKGNPDAFRAWWARYTDEWRNGAQAAIEVPDPQGQLPFVHRPNARSTFFKAEVRINNLGFRGPDIARDKGNRFRIVALGESPTFGTMIEAGDTAWPRVLQSLIETKLVCAHPVEVVNAGVPGYSLVQNIVRMRRSIAPLKPDIVVSYHGFNGLPLIDPVLGEMPAPPIYKRRASPLLAAFRFNMRLSKYAAERKAFGDAGEQTQFSNRYGELYDELAAESKRAGARLFIANMSTAVTGDSPKEVKEFYGRVFSPIDRIVAAIAEHNRLAQAAAARNGAAFIDTRGGLSGAWDRDLFIDLVHFTQKGSDLLAQKVYAALEPSLLAAPVPGCRVRESARND
ncbi:MAG: GDSL-type esterase/lipase family protein, partial [Beijerinckiaceae bacterium]